MTDLKPGFRNVKDVDPVDLDAQLYAEAEALVADIAVGVATDAEEIVQRIINTLETGKKFDEFYFARFLSTEELAALTKTGAILMALASFSKMGLEDDDKGRAICRFAADMVSKICDPEATIVFTRDFEDDDPEESGESVASIFFLTAQDWEDVFPHLAGAIPARVAKKLQETYQHVISLPNAEVLAMPILVPTDHCDGFKAALIEAGMPAQKAEPMPIFGPSPEDTIERLVETGEMAKRMAIWLAPEHA